MFYIEQDNKIVLFDEDKTKLENTLIFIPDYKDLEIKETDKKIVNFESGFYFADDEEYIEKFTRAEAERIGNLECTKRVFVLMLEQLGVGYFDKIEPLIKSNPQAQLEWELCVKLERKNPLLDVMASQLGITPVQLDNLFKYANNEITIEDFKGSTEIEE